MTSETPRSTSGGSRAEKGASRRGKKIFVTSSVLSTRTCEASETLAVKYVQASRPDEDEHGVREPIARQVGQPSEDAGEEDWRRPGLDDGPCDAEDRLAISRREFARREDHCQLAVTTTARGRVTQARRPPARFSIQGAVGARTSRVASPSSVRVLTAGSFHEFIRVHNPADPGASVTPRPGVESLSLSSARSAEGNPDCAHNVSVRVARTGDLHHGGVCPARLGGGRGRPNCADCASISTPSHVDIRPFGLPTRRLTLVERYGQT